MKKALIIIIAILLILPVFGQGYQEDWPYGSEVTLVATPNEGFKFINWTEDGQEVSTDSVYTFTVTGHRNLIANFARKIYTIDAVPKPLDGGEVSGGGEYATGDMVILEGTPAKGYKFSGWHGIEDGVIPHNPYRFRADADYNIIGMFAVKPPHPPYYISFGLILIAGLIALYFAIRKKNNEKV